MTKIRFKLGLIGLVAGAGLFLAPGKVHAASLTVGSGCTLSDAINSVDTQADVNCTSTGTYGISDTITIPAGTVTLSADLPVINKPVVISGASKTTTVINAANHDAFHFSFSVSTGRDVTVQNLKVTGASTAGIAIADADHVTLSSLDIDDSTQGVQSTSAHTIIDSVTVQNCVDSATGEATAGLSANIKPRQNGETSSVSITNSKSINNSAPSGLGSAGMGVSTTPSIEGGGGQPSKYSIVLHNNSVLNNTSGQSAGLFITDQSGPLSTISADLLVDATTIANNTVLVPQAVTISPGQAAQPIVAGFLLSGKLSDQQNFTNVTVAYNTVDNPAPDNRNVMAGFIGTLNNLSAQLRITNVTVVGNSSTAPAAITQFSAFAVIRADITLSENFQVTINGVTNGSRSENGLIAHNTSNGTLQNCNSSINLAILGISGTLDVTPTDLGHNLSDDTSCTGYTTYANLYDTIDHEVKDNGGPVPTIALHDDSPAVNAGGQVLGISTDARGVARSGYYSVGAYQGNILASSTTGGSTVTTAGQLAKTGLFVALATPLGLFLVATPMYLLWDYRRHKQPLLEADPAADYSFWHHLRVVSIPLVKYRLSVSVERKINSSHSDDVTRF